MKENLINDHDQAIMSQTLATIDQDAPIEIGLDDLDYKGPDIEKLRDLYTRLDMRQALKKLPGNEAQQPKKNLHYVVLTDANLGQLPKTNLPVAFEIEMLDDNYHVSPQIGFFSLAPRTKPMSRLM